MNKKPEFDLEGVAAGDVFNQNELVTSMDRIAMETISRQKASEIIVFRSYNVDSKEGLARHSGWRRVGPDESRYYTIFRKKLEEAGLW